MKKGFVVRFVAPALLLASLTCAPGAAFAAPNVQQIESAMSQGDWARADEGLQQVLQAHPGSARAHYLYAQVLDREGQYAQALAQIGQAKSLDPQLRFASPTRFAQIEARIRAHAARARNTPSTAVPTAPRAGTVAQAAQPSPGSALASPAAAPKKHTALWIGLALVLLVAVVFVVRRSRRAKSNDAARADADWRNQLKRATDLLNAVRALKLDVRLSTAPGHDALEKEVDALEAQLRGTIDTLSNSRAAQPPWQIDACARQYESLKARAEGRPDPNASTGAGAESAYAREADANFGTQPQAPWPPQQQQPPVVVQQGGGFGGGMGGLLTGVLLGQALGGSRERERVVERDVYVDNDRQGSDDNALDFGQGSNDWDDGSSGGGFDFGSNDDSGGWDNS